MITLITIQCKKSETNKSVAENQTESSQNLSEKENHKHDKKNDAKYITHEVKVTGDVKHPLILTVDSLKTMKVKEMQDFKIVCQSGITKDDIKTTKGVLLKDILEKAIIAQQEHKDRNFVIVARAADDYKASFSWAELFNNPTGEQVYVLFEQNGKPLAEKGEMILVSMTDTKTGPRHVKWLKSIEVSRIK